jgi:hypothetical protein
MEETMTRSECEAKIKDLFNQIVDVYKEYNPDGEYLDVCIVQGDYCHANNACYCKSENREEGKDYNIPIETSWRY